MIDDGNDEPWAEDLVHDLAKFQQGSLVRNPPFSYYAAGINPIWTATRNQAEPGALEHLVQLDPSTRPPYGVITTQSCDVDEPGTPKRPWIQLAPVYSLGRDDERLASIRNWKVSYLVPVTTLGPEWVADLRVEFPIEKSWLVLQESRPAFTNDADFRRFSSHCGYLRERPGIATEIEDELLKPLSKQLHALRRSDKPTFDSFVADLQYLFLAISGPLLSPQAVQLIFVSKNPFPPAVAEYLERWWEEKFAGNSEGSFAVLPWRCYTESDPLPIGQQLGWVAWPVSRLFK